MSQQREREEGCSCFNNVSEKMTGSAMNWLIARVVDNHSITKTMYNTKARSKKGSKKERLIEQTPLIPTNNY